MKARIIKEVSDRANVRPGAEEFEAQEWERRNKPGTANVHIQMIRAAAHESLALLKALGEI